MYSTTILVTGGAGYIGSHTVVELLSKGFRVIVLDNLCNSSSVVLDRIRTITGTRPEFVLGDIRDRQLMVQVLERSRPEVVVHFAGLKAVGESTEIPITYYDNNVTGTLMLAEAMAETGVQRLVFSSSATVYGDPQVVPIAEDSCVSPTNPYGRTKLMVEEILRDWAKAVPTLRVALLRYFNPAGAHESGLIGEDPKGTPNNLMPYVAQVAAGRLQQLSVFGNDYPTPDGTGIRDYIHVTDLAKGHLAAIDALRVGDSGVLTVNLGTGRGYSVLELVAAFEKASGRKIPFRIVSRRPGDVAACYADPALALRMLSWRANLDLDAMCRDAWRWQSANPDGFDRPK